MTAAFKECIMKYTFLYKINFIRTRNSRLLKI